ncbi:MAG TPA: hypothetical protein VMU14_08885, partial [Acidimicrobiales bacterium]|nr:hypothetical protein [Acidimicrobiales bacterium]
MGPEPGARRADAHGTQVQRHPGVEDVIGAAPSPVQRNLRKPIGATLVAVGVLGLAILGVAWLSSGSGATPTPASPASARSPASPQQGPVAAPTTLPLAPTTTVPLAPTTTVPAPVVRPPANAAVPAVTAPVATLARTSASATGARSSHKNPNASWTPRRFNLGHPKFTPRR